MKLSNIHKLKADWLKSEEVEEEWLPGHQLPDKLEFVEWLEAELEVTDFTQQLGLWKAIAFSSVWLARDEKTRPSSKALRKRYQRLRGCADEIRSILNTTLGDGSLEFWTNDYLISAEHVLGAHGTLKKLELHLKRFDAILEQSEQFIKERKSGRPKDETLWEWVEHLTAHIDFFTEIPITVDYHDSQPITQYARFMHRAIEMLDPSRLPQLANVLTRSNAKQK